MAEQQEALAEVDQSDQVVAILGDIAERSRKLVEDFLARQQDLDGADSRARRPCPARRHVRRDADAPDEPAT